MEKMRPWRIVVGSKVELPSKIQLRRQRTNTKQAVRAMIASITITIFLSGDKELLFIIQDVFRPQIY